jgi:hypothetical protein
MSGRWEGAREEQGTETWWSHVAQDQCVTYAQSSTEKENASWAVVAHVFNPSTWEAEASGFLSLRPAWSTEWVQDSQGYTEKPCLEKQKTKSVLYKSWGPLTLLSRVLLGTGSKVLETHFQFLLLGSLTSALQNPPGQDWGKGECKTEGCWFYPAVSAGSLGCCIGGGGGGDRAQSLSHRILFFSFLSVAQRGQSSGSNPGVDCKVTGQSCSPSSLSQHSQGHRSWETPSGRNTQVHVSPASSRPFSLLSIRLKLALGFPDLVLFRVKQRGMADWASSVPLVFVPLEVQEAVVLCREAGAMEN